MSAYDKALEMMRGTRPVTDVINRGLIAGTLGAPADLGNLALNALKAGAGYVGHETGLLDADQMPELTDNPVGGSEWIGQKMQDAGMVSGERRPLAESFAGVLGPGELMAGGKAAAAAIPALGFMGKVGKVSDSRDALAMIGTAKGKREAATLALREKQRASDVEVARQTGAGTREKVEPNVFRQRYAQAAQGQSDDAAMQDILAEAARGAHLKPKAGGGWVGAPDTVQTRGDLRKLRGDLDTQLDDASAALQFADPERVGNWYDRAKAGQSLIHEPHQLDRGLEQTGVYSAGVAPDSELAFKLKHNVSRALDTGERAYRGPGMRTLDTAVADNRKATLAHKVGEYRGKNDPRIEEKSPFGVNDFRMAQAFKYLDTAGNPWKAGVSDTMHPFMDLETALMVDRANKRSAGGRADWTGAKIQELPWVLNKADDIYGRGKNARFAGPEGQGMALREANKTLADFLPKHTASVPGTEGWSTQGPYQHDLPHWDSPYGKPGPEVGAGARDALYRSADMLQLPTMEAGGQTLARPLVDFATGQTAGVNKNTLDAVGAIEDLRSTLAGREGGRMDLPVTLQSRKGKNDLLLQRDKPLTRQELEDIGPMLDLGGGGKPNAMTSRPVSQGALLTGSGAGDQRAALKLSQQLRDVVPGATLEKAAVESTSVPGVSSPAEAGQGKATGRVLQRFADAPPNLGANVSESDEVRRLIGELPASDRADVMQSRKFFSEADWNRVVRLMRDKGLKPAAAMGALGFSLQGMAAQDER